MKLFNIDNIKKTSIIITPNIPDTSTKTYKFSLFRSAAYVLLYTLVVWLVLIFILSVTPLKDFLFVLDTQELKAQRESINMLQEKVNLLTRELDQIATVNVRMRHAINLALKDSVDSTNVVYDSLKTKIEKKVKIGGNIFLAFQKLISDYQQEKISSETVITFREPINGILTQNFNPSLGHLGIDYGVRTGTPVYASAGGIIIFADYTVESGYMMILQHDNNYTTVYKHCSSLIKKTQDVVSSGELIALSGNTGNNTTGPHLHFEIWHKGKPIDPEKVFIK